MNVAPALGTRLRRVPWLLVWLWSGFYLYAFVRWFGEIHPELQFVDVGVYYRSTAAWVAGVDPWAETGPFAFAGIPPTLLLNLPLLPFGEGVARVFWPIADVVLAGLALRQLGLPIWWLAWPPFVEGWFPGSPDMALFGLAILGGGTIAGFAKPYSVPALLGTGHWRAMAVATAAAIATIPILPWGTFVADLPTISARLASQSLNLSAWGSPLLLGLTTFALITLGRTGLTLLAPGIWPAAQLHYGAFSLTAAARSPLLALGLAIPLPGVAPLAIVAYAIERRLVTRMRVARSVGD